MVPRALLVTIAAILLASCGASKRSTQSANDNIDQIENSGKKLSGDFLVVAVEDLYRVRDAQSQKPILSFDEAGRFKRQDSSRIEEGSYVIDTSDRLIVYVEKVNGEFLSAARVERYLIDDQHGNEAVTLKAASRTFVLTRR